MKSRYLLNFWFLYQFSFIRLTDRMYIDPHNIRHFCLSEVEQFLIGLTIKIDNDFSFFLRFF